MPNDKTIQIASVEAVRSRVDKLRYRSEEIKGRLAEVLIDLWNPERILKEIDPTVDVASLKYGYPQFAEVINAIDNNIYVSSLIEGPFHMSPILLQGNPGLGKTYFVKQLADVLGLPYFEISLATITASFTLSGGSLQWAEGTVGELAKIIARSTVANPIVLLDEVDKCMNEARYNPSNVLYSLLEPHTAKRFKDEALELELDLSHVIWICTANYPELIPAPILSRMNVFEITLPAPKQMQQVVNHMYGQFRSQSAYGRFLAEALEEDVIEELAHLSPREIRINLEESSLKAVRRGSQSISVNDLSRASRKEVHRVGFI